MSVIGISYFKNKTFLQTIDWSVIKGMGVDEN